MRLTPFKRICPHCGKIIDYSEKYCEECTKKMEQYIQNRNKNYDNTRKDDKEWKLYQTKEWRLFQKSVLIKFNYIDIFNYYIVHSIEASIEANTAHHIIEVKQDWNKRFDMTNMFPCSSGTHKTIHNLYLKDKEGTQKLLRELLERYKKEFNIII